MKVNRRVVQNKHSFFKIENCGTLIREFIVNCIMPWKFAPDEGVGKNGRFSECGGRTKRSCSLENLLWSPSLVHNPSDQPFILRFGLNFKHIVFT